MDVTHIDGLFKRIVFTQRTEYHRLKKEGNPDTRSATTPTNLASITLSEASQSPRGRCYWVTLAREPCSGQTHGVRSTDAKTKGEQSNGSGHQVCKMRESQAGGCDGCTR